MTPTDDQNKQPQAQKKIDSLIDFVHDHSAENPLEVEISVDDQNRILFFYNKELKEPISWFEFDIPSSSLSIMLDDGRARDIGLPLAPTISKYMHNTHQILTIFMDDSTGEARNSDYVPLILHH